MSERPTERYPWARIAHHRLQYGSNWRHVATKYIKR